MPSDRRTPSEIERDIEHERAGLDSTVRELQDRFTPDRIYREFTSGFREHGGDIGRAVTRSVKQNPVGLALTGVGLAWLMFGRSYDPLARRRYDHGNGANDYDYDRGDSYPEARYAGRDYELTVPQNASYKRPGRNFPDWVDPDDHDVGLTDQAAYGAHHIGDGVSNAAGSVAGAAGSAGRSVAGAAGSAASGISSAANGAAGAAGSAASGVGNAAGSAGRGVAGAAGSAGRGISSAAGSAGRGISGAAGSAGQGISDAAHRAGEAGSMAWSRLARGTENMSEAARERVVAARRRAIEARHWANRMAGRGREALGRGRDEAADFFEENPLVVGALAIAAGAAIAAALPRTRTEDEWFGAQSDAMIDEAERIYLEERHKAEEVARAVADEAQRVVREKGGKADAAAKSAVEEATSDLKEAANRVGDTAKKEAEKKDLGNPST